MLSVQFRFLAFAVLSVWAIMAGGCVSVSVEKPSVISFGDSQAEIERDLIGACTELKVRVIEPAQIPNAETQSQIDCFGFDYFGAPRLAEFVFADDALILTWILVEEGDLPKLEDAFVQSFGDPAYRGETITGFHDAYAAVRKDIPEALYYAPSVAQILEARMTQ